MQNRVHTAAKILATPMRCKRKLLAHLFPKFDIEFVFQTLRTMR